MLKNNLRTCKSCRLVPNCVHSGKCKQNRRLTARRLAEITGFPNGTRSGDTEDLHNHAS